MIRIFTYVTSLLEPLGQINQNLIETIIYKIKLLRHSKKGDFHKYI